MATGSDGGAPDPSPQGSPPPKKARRKKVQDPIGTSPWGDPSTPEAQSHQALITAISEAASPVQDFIQALISSIVDGLGSAVTELGNLAQDIQLTIGQGLTPGVMALSQMRQDVRTAIRGQISQSAEYASAGLGQPVYYQQDGSLNVVTAGVHPSIPLNPDHNIPGRSLPSSFPRPEGAPARPGEPHFPGGAPAYPGTGTPTPAPPRPTSPPLPPGPVGPPPVPGVPGYPGFPRPGSNPIGPRPWGLAGASSSAASTPGASAPGGVSGGRGMDAPGGGGGGGYYWSPEFGGPLQSAEQGCNGTITDGSDPPEGSRWTVNNDGAILWSMPNCSYYDTDPTAPSPSPSPTPTPKPSSGLGPPPFVGPPAPPPTFVNPYDPSNPNPLGPPPAPPTPPDYPPKYAPPIPFPPYQPPAETPPNATPYVPPDNTPPPPPDTPCPRGSSWVYNGYYYECQGNPPPPPTPPTPEPQPIPEPEPTGGGGAPQRPPACSGMRDDPCWRAANPADERDIAFNVTAGFASILAKDKAAILVAGDLKDAQVNIAPGIQDNGGGPQICDPVYQFTLVVGDLKLEDIIPTLGDSKQYLHDALEDRTFTDKVMQWTLFAPIVAVITFAFGLLSRLTNAIWKQFMGLGGSLGSEVQTRTVLKLLNLICLGGLERIIAIYDNASNFNYPVEVPSPEAAAAAWLGREIDECTFETYVRAGNYKYPNYKQVVRAGKLHFTALELKTLDKRHGLVRMGLPDRLRELGSLHEEDLQELETLFQQLPGPADITRFMTRDTDNAEIVSRFRLDDGFTDNFVGQLKEWAANQGVSEDVMRRFWRAQYDIPSPTQLYLMLHRFRHGGDPTPGGDIESDVRLALRQQDILPYWHDRLIGIAYHPLNRTDLNRAYERGWIDDERYLKGMYDNGYNDDDAATLLRFASRERALSIRHADFTTAYSHGYIDPDTLRSWAESEGYEGEVLSEIQEVADFQLRVRTWEDQTKAISHQFKACRITEDEAREDASALGIPDSVIDRALGISELNTTCGTRREMVGSLCQALDAGFISPQEYVDRMRKLKYDQFAIDNYLGLCVNKIAARKAKEAARAQKEAEREIEKEIKAEEKAQRQAEARANRLAKALATQERRRVQRNDKLEKVGSKLGQSITDMDGPDAAYVDMLWRGLQDIKGLSQDDAANVLVVTSGASKGMTRVEYRDWVYEVAPLALTEPWQLFPSVPVVTNGHS